ncbi:MAG: hypothetical protein ABSA59_16500 [Terriglobia bacterium]|jgi:hypothetical protein
MIKRLAEILASEDREQEALNRNYQETPRFPPRPPRTIKPALCTSNVCLGKDTGGPATTIMGGAGSKAEPVAGVSAAGFEETAA